MAESRDSLCEEPDDDFFDTFFDDGVLETIGEVLSDAKGVHAQEESFSSTVDDVPKVSNSGTQETGPENDTISLHCSKSQGSTLSFDECQIIETCSTKTDGEDKSKNHNDTTSKMCPKILIKSSLNPPNRMPHQGPHKTELLGNVVNVKMSGPTDEEESSKETNSSYLSNDNKKYYSVKELLGKVKSCLLKTHVISLGSNVNKTSETSSKGAISVDKEDILSKECQLPIATHCQNLSVNDALDTPGTSKTACNNSCLEENLEMEEGEISENFKEDVCSPNSSASRSSLELTPLKSILSDTESKISRDDTEKENDLVSDEVCSTKNNPQPIIGSRKKIKINLKTQILASTTILNKSTSTTKENSLSPGRNKAEAMTSKSSPQHKEIGVKRKRDDSKERESCEQEAPKQSQKKKESRKNKKRHDISPESRKSRSHKKREKLRKSRSKSPPHYSPNRRKRKSSDRRKRRRSPSRSLSKSPPGRYGRRTNWSPKRCRSRSRSPFQYRSRKSPSPGSRRCRVSRSRSRSPFINEIERWKKQWDREDKEKRTCATLPHTSLNTSSSLPLSVPSWNSDPPMATIVSNMVSVSVESVQLHSSSFSPGIPKPPDYLGCSTLDTYMGPHFSGNPGTLSMPFMPPFSIPPPRGYPVQPEVPGLAAAFQASPSNFQYPQLYSSPPLPAGTQHSSSSMTGAPSVMPSVSVPCSVALSTQTGTVHPQRSDPPKSSSVLRKQLDILLSTVGNQNTPPLKVSQSKFNAVTSFKTTNHPLVPIDCEPVSSPESGDSSAKTTMQSLIQSGCEPVSSPDSEVNNQSFVEVDCELVSSPDSGSTSLPLIQTGCEPVSSSDAETTERSAPGPFSSVEVKTHCIKAENLNTDPHSAEQLKQLPSDQQESSVEIDVNNLSPSQVSTEKGESTLDAVPPTEYYDSDVIIEEMPPKPPPEVICISGDEANDGATHDLEKDDSAHDINNDDPIHESDNSNEIYDLEEALDKIHDDTRKLNKLDSPSDMVEKNCTQKRRKKKKKRRKNKSHDTSSGINNEVKDDKNSKEKNEESNQDLERGKEQETMNDHDCVLKECRDMIDTLRIGRFIFSEDYEPETTQLLSSLHSGFSNSPLLYERPKVEFSFSLPPATDVTQRSRDACTNTPHLLQIDVCVNTDSTADLKDRASQTDLSCLGCEENRNLIKQMSAELERMKKERDELLSIVHDIGKASIPGLGSSAEESSSSVYPIGGDERLARQLLNNITIDNRCLPVQTTQSFSTAVSTCTKSLALDYDESFTISQTDSTLNQPECIPGEPILAYDYNHTSPIPFQTQSQVNGNTYSGSYRSH